MGTSAHLGDAHFLRRRGHDTVFLIAIARYSAPSSHRFHHLFRVLATLQTPLCSPEQSPLRGRRPRCSRQLGWPRGEGHTCPPPRVRYHSGLFESASTRRYQSTFPERSQSSRSTPGRYLRRSATASSV